MAIEIPYPEPTFDPSPLFLWLYIIVVAIGYYLWLTRASPLLSAVFSLPGDPVPASAGAAYHDTTTDPPPPQRAQQPKILNLRDFGPLGIDQTDLVRLKLTRGRNATHLPAGSPRPLVPLDDIVRNAGSFRYVPLAERWRPAIPPPATPISAATKPVDAHAPPSQSSSPPPQTSESMGLASRQAFTTYVTGMRLIDDKYAENRQWFLHNLHPELLPQQQQQLVVLPQMQQPFMGFVPQRAPSPPPPQPQVQQPVLLPLVAPPSEPAAPVRAPYPQKRRPPPSKPVAAVPKPKPAPKPQPKPEPILPPARGTIPFRMA